MRGWFLFLLLIALLFRFLFLGTNPAGVFHDEAEKGYSAYCVLKIGGTLDFTQQALMFHPIPLFVNVWGSTTSMIYQYAAVPFIATGGLNAWTLRLPAAIVGTLTVILTFFLARKLTGDTRIGLWAMGLLACAPWHVVFSRWAQQGIFVPLLVSAALILLLQRYRDTENCNINGHPLCLCASVVKTGFLAPILFGLAFYAYSVCATISVIVSGAGWRSSGDVTCWRTKKEPCWRWVMLALVLTPTFYVMLRGGGSGMGRFNTLSVLKATDENGLLLPLSIRAFIFVKNYLSHFSPQFLFFTGDALQRHGLPGFGVMLHIEMLFLIAGIYRAYRRKSPGDLLLLGWFLLMPFSAALTREGIPHALRTLHAIPCPQILSAIGAVELLDWLRGKNRPVLAKALVALTGLNALAVAFSLFFLFPRASAPWFEAGIGEAIKTAGAARLVVLSGGVQNGGNLPYYYELYHYHKKNRPGSVVQWPVRARQRDFYCATRHAARADFAHQRRRDYPERFRLSESIRPRAPRKRLAVHAHFPAARPAAPGRHGTFVGGAQNEIVFEFNTFSMYVLKWNRLKNTDVLMENRMHSGNNNGKTVTWNQLVSHPGKNRNKKTSKLLPPVHNGSGSARFGRVIP